MRRFLATILLAVALAATARAQSVTAPLGPSGIQPGGPSNLLGYTTGSISANSGTLTDTTAAPFQQANVGNDIFVFGIGANGSALTAVIGTVNAPSSITFANGVTASYPSGNSYIRFAQVVAPGTGCVPGSVETLAGGTALLQGQLTVASCFLSPASVSNITIAAAGSGGTVSATNCVVNGTSGTNPLGWGDFQLVVDTNSSGQLSAVVAVLYGGAYSTNPTVLTAEPVSSETCGALTGAEVNISTAMGVLTTTVTVNGSYSSVPATATVSNSTGGITGDTYSLVTGTAGQYVFGPDITASLTSSINAANAAWTTNNQAQTINLNPGNFFIAGSTLPAMTNGVRIHCSGNWQTRIYFAPSYTGAFFQWNNTHLVTDPSLAVLPFNDTTGGGISDCLLVGDPEYDQSQTGISLKNWNDNFLIQNVLVYFGYGPCLYAGDASGTLSQQRESAAYNLQCYANGTPTLGQVAMHAFGSGSVLNNWRLDSRVYFGLGPGFQITSADATKTSSYIRFLALSAERSGQANPAACGVYWGAPGDVGSVTKVFAQDLQIINTDSEYSCGLNLGGDAGTPSDYDLWVSSGSIAQVQNGIVYGNVRDTNVALTTIESINAGGAAVIASANMGALNYLAMTQIGSYPLGMYVANPANLAISTIAAGGGLGGVRVQGKVYGAEFGGTLTGEALGAASTGYFQRFDVGSSARPLTANIDVTAANTGSWHWEACIYQDFGGIPEYLVADTGSVTGITTTGAQSAPFLSTITPPSLVTPDIMPGPASYWVEFLADSASESFYSMIFGLSSGQIMNQVGANSAANFFAGTTPQGRITTGTQTVGTCPSTAPNSTMTASKYIPYVALGF